MGIADGLLSIRLTGPLEVRTQDGVLDGILASINTAFDSVRALVWFCTSNMDGR